MYTDEILIDAKDVDLADRMKVSSLVAYLQETAAHDVNQYGWGWYALGRLNICFVITRINIRMHSYPKVGDKLLLSSWMANKPKLIFERAYKATLEDGTPVLEAMTEWVLINTETRTVIKPVGLDLPVVPDEAVGEHIFETDRCRIVFEPQQTQKQIPVYSDFDYNGHVNNAKYIEWVEDMLPAEEHKTRVISELEMKYEAEILPGSEVLIKSAADGDTYYYKGESTDGKNHFTAKIDYRSV